MAVTMRDIARKASVSQATVSLVLGSGKNKYKFSQETIDRVQQAADDLGYRPNKTACVLRNQKNCLVGVLGGGYRMNSFAGFLEGVNSVVEPDYGVVTAVHNYEGANERASLKMFIDMRVSGIIAYWSGDEKSLPLYKEIVDRYEIDLFVVDKPLPGIDVPCFSVSDYDMSFLAVEAFVGLGHKNIMSCTFDTTQRGHLKGFVDGMAAHDLQDCFGSVVFPIDEKFWTKEYKNNIKDYAHLVMNALNDSKKGFTAILVQDDLLAYELMYELSEKGLRIPEDISVMGMGNYESSDLPQISLSSVGSKSFTDNGIYVSSMLLKMVNGEEICDRNFERELQVYYRKSTRKIE